MLFHRVLQRRRGLRHLTICLLINTVHQLLMILITTPRRSPNLLHWLPLMLSVQRALLGDMGDSGTGNRDEQPGM